MASKRRNTFHKNKTQETTEKGRVRGSWRRLHWTADADSAGVAGDSDETGGGHMTRHHHRGDRRHHNTPPGEKQDTQRVLLEREPCYSANQVLLVIGLTCLLNFAFVVLVMAVVHCCNPQPAGGLHNRRHYRRREQSSVSSSASSTFLCKREPTVTRLESVLVDSCSETCTEEDDDEEDDDEMSCGRGLLGGGRGDKAQPVEQVGPSVVVAGAILCRLAERHLPTVSESADRARLPVVPAYRWLDYGSGHPARPSPPHYHFNRLCSFSVRGYKSYAAPHPVL
ncbi:hypothetical protein AAG570_005414 [Ranatra chinensis]|uniref:Uncharacterized protein n=1 Tax=Ranatra chinensis TaxID=642074 RepID=A0ABD0YJ40_9HEMI